jgi:pimeloyl-ACP methyl ester carboxylesterase
MREMADDVIAVADALGSERVHLLGGSLGATIAQATAIHHPDRVASLTLYCAAPGGAPWLNRPNLWTALKMLRLMNGASPEAAAEGQRWVDLHHLLGSPAYPVDEAHWRRAGALAFERGINGAGSLRHSAAYFRAWDLRSQLARLDLPTLVVQGANDPLQSWRAGRATAKAIPGAKFLLLPGVGHDLPMEVWPTILDEVVAMAGRGSVLG